MFKLCGDVKINWSTRFSFWLLKFIGCEDLLAVTYQEMMILKR